MLTGDIEKQAEAKLVGRYNETIQSDILAVPHHGSNTSSIRNFIYTVKLEIAIIPAGWLNRFHLPSTKVVRRFQDLNVDLLSTGQYGAILISTGENMEVVAYHHVARRYWYYQNETNDTSRYAISLLK